VWRRTGLGGRYLHDPLLDDTVGVLTPFAAFLLTEEVHASGVLAVVSGLAMSQMAPLQIAAQTRIRARACWQVSTFLLNGAFFVIVGLQSRTAVANLVSSSPERVTGVVLSAGDTVVFADTAPARS
jgi:CPA1 family monovalent cation:H+ antiporter